jgi:hypothetical protein
MPREISLGILLVIGVSLLGRVTVDIMKLADEIFWPHWYRLACEIDRALAFARRVWCIRRGFCDVFGHFCKARGNLHKTFFSIFWTPANLPIRGLPGRLKPLVRHDLQ